MRRMEKSKRFIGCVCLLLGMAWIAASCSNGVEEGDVPPTGEMTLSIGFQVPTRNGGEEASLYEVGETYENYIDVARGNYRIYFFDDTDKLIARFEPQGFVTTEGSDYTEYSVLGKAPAELVRHSDFKVMVIANWPQYDDKSVEAGTTTIADICNADWAKFSCPTNENKSPTSVALNPAKNILMPFYGIREYTGVTFLPGQATILPQPVTLLRAMAKVEVILEADDYFNLSFSSLEINRYNKTGYCAPKDVTTHDGYDHDKNWEADYVHTLHLVGGKNDETANCLAFRLAKKWDGKDGKRFELWTAYLPEYQNKDLEADGAYSSIEAKFNIQLQGDTPHTIHFAEYTAGTTDNTVDANRLNIERNNLYRFHVKCTGYNFKLFLTVSDWEGLYVNDFEYGDGQIVSPVAPWEDQTDINVDLN